MDCSDVHPKLFGYVDGELDLEARGRVDTHLRACGPCRQLVDLELQFHDTYVERLRPDPAPPRVWERTTALLGALVAQQRAGRRRSLGWALALALIGLGTGVALVAPLRR